MIAGEVNSDGVPIVHLKIDDGQWPAIVDSGFNGDLELPRELQALFEGVFVGRVRSVLAGGQVVLETIYRIEFPFDGRKVVADVAFADCSEILVGTRLMREYRLEIDFPKKNRSADQRARKLRTNLAGPEVRLKSANDRH